MCLQPATFKCSLFSSWRNCRSVEDICHSLVPRWLAAGMRCEAGTHLLGLGCDVNKRIRGVRWQAWNGTSCRQTVRIVQEKAGFHRDYWSPAAGVCCSATGFQERPTNPFICSYHWQISSSLCVCVWRGSIYRALLRQRAECSTLFGLSTVAGLPDNRLTGERGQMRGQTVERRPTRHLPLHH